MKRLSLYSAICLLIIGIYSVSVFAQDQNSAYGKLLSNSNYDLTQPENLNTSGQGPCGGRAPGSHCSELTLNYKIDPSDGSTVEKKVADDVNNPRFCKPAGHTQSLDTFYDSFNQFMKIFRNALGNNGHDLKEFEENLPRLDTVVENGKVKIIMKNVPRCFMAFDSLGSSLPQDKSGDVYVPYLTVRQDIYNDCGNSKEKWKCKFDSAGNTIGNFFRKKFNEHEFSNNRFDSKEYMDLCLKETQKELNKNLKKSNNPDLITREFKIEFDDIRDKRVLSSKKFDQYDEYCMKSSDEYHLANFKDYIYKDGEYFYRNELGVHCSNAPGVATLLDSSFLDSLEAINLKVNDENLVNDLGTGEDQKIINLGNIILANDENACEKIEENEKFPILNLENLNIKKDDLDKFATSLNNNVREIYQRYEKASDEYQNGNNEKAKDYLNLARSSITGANGLGSIYNPNKILALAKTLSRSGDFVKNGFINKLYESYAKLKEIDQTESIQGLSYKSPVKKGIYLEREKQQRDLSICTAYAATIDGVGECNISHKQTTKLIEYLESKKDDFKEDEDSYKSPRSIAGSYSTPKGVSSLMDSAYSVSHDPPTLKDLNARIDHLKERAKYLKKFEEEAPDKVYASYEDRCISGKIHNFKDSESDFFKKLSSNEDIKDNKKVEEKASDSGNVNADILKEMMNMQMQMMYANGNSGTNANGYYNQVGGYNDMGPMYQYMNNMSNQMYSMGLGNLQMHNSFMNQYNTRADSLTNFQFATTNFLLQNSMNSQYFGQQNPLMYPMNPMGSFNSNYNSSYGSGVPQFNVYYKIPVYKNEDSELKFVS